MKNYHSHRRNKALRFCCCFSYHKFTRGKDLSRYSSTDLDCIFGSKAVEEKRKKKEKLKNELLDESKTIPEEIETENPPTTSSSAIEEKDGGLVTINSGSLHDYFAKKMKAIQKKPVALESTIAPEEMKEEEQAEKSEKKGRKRKAEKTLEVEVVPKMSRKSCSSEGDSSLASKDSIGDKRKDVFDVVEKHDGEIATINSGSIHDYFAKKMNAVKKKSLESLKASNAEEVGQMDNQQPQIENFEEKDRKRKARKTVEVEEVLRNQDKKSKKKRKSTSIECDSLTFNKTIKDKNEDKSDKLKKKSKQSEKISKEEEDGILEESLSSKKKKQKLNQEDGLVQDEKSPEIELDSPDKPSKSDKKKRKKSKERIDLSKVDNEKNSDMNNSQKDKQKKTEKSKIEVQDGMGFQGSNILSLPGYGYR